MDVGSNMINQKLFLICLAYFIALTGFLNANPFTLAKNITNATHSLKYYYWMDSDDSKYYLAKKNKDNTYSAWMYTDDRKWKPIHNTKSFDGFPEADKYFKEISFNSGAMKISKPCSDCEDKNPPSPLPFNAKKSVVFSEAKMTKVSYYFWIDKFGIAYLMKPRESSEISLWHYTKDRKWEPIHNADKFDGFMAMKKTFKETTFNIDNDTAELTIGDYNDYIMEDFSLKLFSKDLSSDNTLTNKFLYISPSFHWSYDDKYKYFPKNFILQIKRQDDKSLIYSTFIDGNKSELKQGKGKSDMSILPREVYCEKSYMGENIKNEEQIKYQFILYAVFDDSPIVSNPSCIEDISKKENHFAKAELDATLFSKNSVRTNENFIRMHSDESSKKIEFTFLDNTINSLAIIKDEISVRGLNKEVQISYDRTSDNSIIATLSGKIKSNEGRDKVKIEFHFSSSLFAEALEKTQYTYVMINL